MGVVGPRRRVEKLEGFNPTTLIYSTPLSLHFDRVFIYIEARYRVVGTEFNELYKIFITLSLSDIKLQSVGFWQNK